MTWRVASNTGRRVWNWLLHDLTELAEVLSPPAPPAPGLYPYCFTSGGKRRLQLRIEADGNGLLFIDAAQVVHLNPAAVILAKYVLDGESFPRIWSVVRRYAPMSDLSACRELVEQIERLKTPGTCPRCDSQISNSTPFFHTQVGAPYKADLALTYGCNNHCAHCYNEPGRHAGRMLTPTQWQAVIDHLFKIGVPYVIFTGGEATLCPALPALVACAAQRGLATGLNTNGRRLAQIEYAETLRRAGLDHVQITLHAATAALHDHTCGTRAFAETVAGIENALACGLHTLTNTTLRRENAPHVESLLDLLSRLGVRTFAMNSVIPAGHGRTDSQALAEDELGPLLLRVREMAQTRGMTFLWYTPTAYCRLSPVELELGAKRCNAAEYSVCIEPNGDVLPCQSYYAPAGNVLRDPWETIWNSAIFRRIRDRNCDPAAAGLPQACWTCPDLTLCGGGCPLTRQVSLQENEPCLS